MLDELPIAQAQALVLGFIDKYTAGDVSLTAFHKLAMEALRDGRIGLAAIIVNHYPIPQFAESQDPEKEIMQERLDAVRASLPGIYGAVHAASYRMQQTIKEVDEQKEAESPLVDYRKELTEALDAYPVWRAFVIHQESTIRLTALSRLGATNNPIKEAAIVFALGDSSPNIRQRARNLLGEPSSIRHRSSYSAKDVRGRGTTQQAIMQIVNLSTDDELRGFFDDPRTNVRYAATLQLKPSSMLWEMLASDASARVRRVVAERVPMSSKEIVSQLLQDPNQAVRTTIGKRKLQEDIELPARAPEPEAQPKPDPIKQRQAEWAQRMENEDDSR